jgi:hypothetical protein
MANLLFETSKGLGPRGAHLHLDTAGWLRTWTPHQNQAADAAARFFAQHYEWPAVDPEPACQLYFRCLFAIERCIEAHASQPEPPDTSDAQRQIFETLLIDSWHLGGIEWAERRYGAQRVTAARGW